MSRCSYCGMRECGCGAEDYENPYINPTYGRIDWRIGDTAGEDDPPWYAWPVWLVSFVGLLVLAFTGHGLMALVAVLPALYVAFRYGDYGMQ